MRLPDIPKVDWDHVFKFLEKALLIYNVFEGVMAMFSFFSKIKAEFAALVAKFDALEAKVESYFADKAEAPVAEVKVDTAPEVAAKTTDDAAKQ